MSHTLQGWKTGMFPELPAVGEWCEDQKIYKYGDNKAKCLQGHNRTIYPIEETPSIVFDDLYRCRNVWVRPTGAHDSYEIGDCVHFPTIQ